MRVGVGEPRFVGSFDADVDRIREDAAREIAAAARARAPVRTGRLRAGINPDPNDPGSVVSAAPYSADVEWGTSRAAPKPFMAPAIDEVADRLNEGG